MKITKKLAKEIFMGDFEELTKELSENNIIYEERGYFSVFNKTSMKRVGNIVKCGNKWVYKKI